MLLHEIRGKESWAGVSSWVLSTVPPHKRAGPHLCSYVGERGGPCPPRVWGENNIPGQRSNGHNRDMPNSQKKIGQLSLLNCSACTTRIMLLWSKPKAKRESKRPHPACGPNLTRTREAEGNSPRGEGTRGGKKMFDCTCSVQPRTGTAELPWKGKKKKLYGSADNSSPEGKKRNPGAR